MVTRTGTKPAKKAAAKKAPAKLTRKTAESNGISKEAASRALDKSIEGRNPARAAAATQSRKNVAILEGLLAMSPAERGAALDELSRTELSEKFIALRNERGLSQREVAEIYGGGQADLTKVENSTYGVSVASMQRIARALGARLVITLER